MVDFLKVGSEFKVNSQTAGFQDFPSITGLAGGGFVATWVDTSGLSGLGAAKAQIFNVAGQAVGAEFAISTGGATEQSFPTIASLASGGFVVTWTEAGIQADYKIKAQVYNASGAVVTPGLLVNSGTWTQQGGNNVPGQHSTTITGLSGGGFVVTWQDYAGTAGDSSGAGILAQLYTAGGAPLGAAFRVNTQTSADQSQPVVTSISGGGFAVTWIDGNAVDPVTGFPAATMKVQLFNAAGSKVGSEVLVDAKVLNDQSLPTVTGLTGGGFVVSWQDSNPGSGDPDTAIRAQVIDSAGAAIGAAFTVSTVTAGERDFPSITSLANGGFVVTWQHFVTAENSDIKAQIYNADGTPLGSEMTINTVTASYQERPVVTSLLGGGFVVTWGDSSGTGGDADGTSIKAQVYSYGAYNMIYGTPAINALTGTSGDDHILGLGSNDSLTGLGGNDRLDGGTGNDTMIGGLGDDTYVVDASGDVVTEAASQGTDTVETTRASYTLGSNVENLTFTNAINHSGTGNTLNNTLAGAGGNDTLNGGTGADRMVGGLGNDNYYIDNTGDVVVEAASAGTDKVNSAISWTLAANFERLTLSGSAAINGTGNGDANVLTGNSAANVLTGLGGNDTIDGLAGADTMIGGLGGDRYTVDNAGDVVTELAGEGTDLVTSSVSHTLAANVEQLTLSGTAAISGTGNGDANLITGNSGVNVLTGLGGNDTISGGAGADTMVGGLGDDSYVVDKIGDVVTELVGQGTELVTASATYTLAANVENLTLSGSSAINGTGNGDANVLTGNSGANVLTGLGGNDTINGGAGADTMVGGLGDDIYVVDSTGDVVTEAAGQGTDTVQTALSGYTMAANVEALVFTNSAAHSGIGNALANTLTGNAGNDTLNGGAGADTLIGGLGNDSYVVDDGGDVVTELAAQGTDLVTASISYTLAANLENLTLSGTAAISGTGNGDANLITGNSGANVLTGLGGNDMLNGGAGVDTLVGGLGDDTYVVDNAGDVVTEAAGQGTDTVQTTLGAWTLASDVENLTFTNSSSHTGIGNALNNRLTGNNGNDSLNGGAGVDTMIGGLGNDSYTVDDAGDVVTEAASAGTDMVAASLNWTLGANLENLILSGTAALDGTGNTLANVLTGNTGNNVLAGMDGNDTLAGGLGNDTLQGGVGTDRLTGGNGNDSLNGGAGADTFVFETAANASTNYDTVQDFTSGSDVLAFSRAVFNGFSAVGGISADAFWSGSGVNAAHDATDRFIYNTATGVLWYDRDGTGSTAAVAVATLTGQPALAHTDFQIIA